MSIAFLASCQFMGRPANLILHQNILIMAQILNIISSPRGEASNSIKLANAIIERLCENDPYAVVTHKDLNRDPLPHLSSTHLGRSEEHTSELQSREN